MAGVKIVPLTTYTRDNYQLPSDEKIKESISTKTKAILLCNPNNPTGAVYPPEDLRKELPK